MVISGFESHNFSLGFKHLFALCKYTLVRCCCRKTDHTKQSFYYDFLGAIVNWLYMCAYVYVCGWMLEFYSVVFAFCEKDAKHIASECHFVFVLSSFPSLSAFNSTSILFFEQRWKTTIFFYLSTRVRVDCFQSCIYSILFYSILFFLASSFRLSFSFSLPTLFGATFSIFWSLFRGYILV